MPGVDFTARCRVLTVLEHHPPAQSPCRKSIASGAHRSQRPHGLHRNGSRPIPRSDDSAIDETRGMLCLQTAFSEIANRIQSPRRRTVADGDDGRQQEAWPVLPGIDSDCHIATGSLPAIAALCVPAAQLAVSKKALLCLRMGLRCRPPSQVCLPPFGLSKPRQRAGRGENFFLSSEGAACECVQHGGRLCRSWGPLGR